MHTMTRYRHSDERRIFKRRRCRCRCRCKGSCVCLTASASKSASASASASASISASASVTNMRLYVFIALSLASLSTVGQALPRGWAKSAINTAVFRKNSLVTHNGEQYAAWYDSTSHVILAKRQLDAEGWSYRRTQLTGNTADAHNSISIMDVGDGYLRIAWKHHGSPLQYGRSIATGSLVLTNTPSMRGTEEGKDT